jgi:hypothetical protein
MTADLQPSTPRSLDAIVHQLEPNQTQPDDITIVHLLRNKSPRLSGSGDIDSINYREAILPSSSRGRAGKTAW